MMSKRARLILEKTLQLSGIARDDAEDPEATLLRGLEAIERRMATQRLQHETDRQRVASILDVVMALAQLDYAKKATLSENADHIDGLAAGINMLGEELKGSTVSLQEKEVLLKEVHHRVKNNLQIISSLVNLQAGQIEEPFFREKAMACRDRILSMALVHEKLYESTDFSLIDFNDYAESLTRSLNLSYNPDNARIALETITTAGDLGNFRIGTAIPCGLLLNELLSNCFKYAFPGTRSGNITVRFEAKSNGKQADYLLSVADDGVGLPANFEPEKAESLGMQLLYMLTGQLDGKLSIDGTNGTAITLRFRQ